ncbi:MAG: hypothetical protein K2N72_08875 [Oscillospiraceae bacterium]|nr:hypothetical protein [Oscillospiraceae bacterium]
MKFLSGLMNSLREYFNKTAPGVLRLVYIAAVCFIITAVYTGESDIAWAIGAAVAVTVVMQMVTALPEIFSENQLPSYDVRIIQQNFPFTMWNRLYSAVSLIHRGEDSEALDMLGDIKGAGLTERQKAVTGFYQSVCYSRMGYPTNAGRCAAEAADNNICVPESMLMAARSFAMAGNFSQSEEYYEKLIPISEEQRVYPFIYNEMGKVYLSSQKGDKAEKAFERALEIGFSSPNAQGGMALACLMQNRRDEACDWYRLALLSRIEDDDGYKEFAAQICRALGLPEDYLDAHLREKYADKTVRAAK